MHINEMFVTEKFIMIKMHEMLHFLQIFLILLVSWPSRFN